MLQTLSRSFRALRARHRRLRPIVFSYFINSCKQVYRIYSSLKTARLKVFRGGQVLEPLVLITSYITAFTA